MKTKKGSQGARPSGPRRTGGAGRRPANESLEAFMKIAMTGRGPMGIADIAKAVKRAGYASASENLDKIVGMRLGSRKSFRRVRRGVYEVK